MRPVNSPRSRARSYRSSEAGRAFSRYHGSIDSRVWIGESVMGIDTGALPIGGAQRGTAGVIWGCGVQRAQAGEVTGG